MRSKPINLALQGGGAHGAFTWGVLDAILDDGRIEIAGVSGTSAGAMNAVALASGMHSGGPEGARSCLRHLWESIGDIGRTSPIKRTPIDWYMGNWNLDNSPSFLWFDLISRLSSPYDFNPLSLNPLRDLVSDAIDFDAVRACEAFELFVSATNVETGRIKLFDRKAMSVDAVMASAALPQLYKAVEIDGVPYWDGGYMGNPALFPLFENPRSADILVVQINPIERKGVPDSSREIINRVNEITFNGSLMREFRAIDFVNRLTENASLSAPDYRKILVHRLTGFDDLDGLNASSKMNAEAEFISFLFDKGLAHGKAWIEQHYDDLGERSTVDLRAIFSD